LVVYGLSVCLGQFLSWKQTFEYRRENWWSQTEAMYRVSMSVNRGMKTGVTC